MKKNIALVTGGFSGEAVISYKSAKTIDQNLDRNRYNVYLIDITREGWFYKNGEGKKIEIDRNDFTLQENGSRIKFDAVYIGLHGTPGEDGKLQGYFDTLDIPYTSCDSATSALTFNKRYTVAVAAMAGINVAHSVHLFSDTPYDVSQLMQQLNFPVFVKPNNGGSSIGMSKVIEPAELEQAIKKAFKEDSQVLVEEMIAGREFTIGVFKSKGEIIALPITEIIPKKDFFDYEAKYEGASEEITPADIPGDIAGRIRDAAKKVYQVFNCRGIVRIDFIFNEADKQPYMLEINTIPGQTDASLIPQQVRAMGWNLTDFYTKLVEEALR